MFEYNGVVLVLQEGTVDQVGLRPGRDAIRLEFERLVQPRTGRTFNARAFNRFHSVLIRGIPFGILYCPVFYTAHR